MSEAKRFFDLLFPEIPDDQKILVWTTPGKKSVWCSTTDEAARVAVSTPDQNVYFGCGLSPMDFGPSARCQAAHIAAVPGVWADVDIRHGVHQKSALPETAEEALEICPPDVKPSLVVHTGHGLHFYWLFEEVFSFDDAAERTWVERIVRRWQGFLRARAGIRGWTIDHTHDLSRVLRVPGTMNVKEDGDPKPVTIFREGSRRYSPGDLDAILDDNGILKEFHSPAVKNAGVAGVSSFVLDPDVTTDPEKLQAYLEVSPKFKATWLRRRYDMVDDSQSSYDLAIANFGLDNGLTEQEIVNLLIEHRRAGGKNSKLRPDYYRRTLDRAYTNGAGAQIRKESAPPLVTPKPSPAPPPPAAAAAEQGQSAPPPQAAPEPDPEPEQPKKVLEEEEAPLTDLQKAQVCESLSATLGVKILRIVKIVGKNPTYVVETPQHKVEIEKLQDLISQASLRYAIGAACDKLIRRFRPKEWDKITESIMMCLIHKEGGAELHTGGEMEVFLLDYLTSVSWLQRNDPKHEKSTMARRPTVIIDGGNAYVAVSAVDVSLYVGRQFGVKLTPKAVASSMTVLGARSYRWRTSASTEQSRWLLPPSKFKASELGRSEEDFIEEREED